MLSPKNNEKSPLAQSIIFVIIERERSVRSGKDRAEDGIRRKKKMGIFGTSVYFYQILHKRRYDYHG